MSGGTFFKVIAVVGTVLAATVALSASAVAGTTAPTRQVTSLTTLETGVLSQINQVRTQHGLVALRRSTKLATAAGQHSVQMGQDGYFAHTSVDGSAFWKRIAKFYPTLRYGLWSVGENLLWASPNIDARGALKLWLGSPEHRANLLDPRWREVGLSAVHVAAAPGSYHGLDVTIVTADFGVRK